MKLIQFKREYNGKPFVDTIVLFGDQTKTDDEIEQIKEERFQAWKLTIDQVDQTLVAPVVTVVESIPSEPIDGN